jgi:hypothetical protein
MGLHLVLDPHWIRIQQSLNLDPVTVLRILITLILIRIRLFRLVRTRILPHIKVMQICGHRIQYRPS